MKSICIFVHYSNEEFIPASDLKYCFELSKHFNEIIFATNDRSIKNESFYNWD
jgi:hypothetical protein